mmetsp:Transcript_41156/g.122898  ORF Transcript_41156/g.122898 Transcript_41156/m.122898 type:complete len:86 (+) Transcript_41156:539-796(+)
MRRLRVGDSTAQVFEPMPTFKSSVLQLLLTELPLVVLNTYFTVISGGARPLSPCLAARCVASAVALLLVVLQLWRAPPQRKRKRA